MLIDFPARDLPLVWCQRCRREHEQRNRLVRCQCGLSMTADFHRACGRPGCGA